MEVSVKRELTVYSYKVCTILAERVDLHFITLCYLCINT